MVKNSFFAGFLSILMLLTPLHTAQAGVWGENIASALGKFALEEVRNILYELGKASLDILKSRGAINALSNAAFDDAPAWISDYKEYLIEKPVNAAAAQSEQYLTKALHGRTEGNYQQRDDAGTLESFDSVLFRISARSIPHLVSNKNRDILGVDYIDSCQLVQGQPEFFGVKDERSFNCFSAMFQNSLNHPEGLKAAARGAYEKLKAEQEEIARTEAQVADGALPQLNEHGVVVKSAAVVAHTVTQLNSKATEFLANFQNEHPIAQIIIQEASSALIKYGEKKILEESARLRERGRRELERLERTIDEKNAEANF